MIAETRAYIKEQIAKVDSDLSENISIYYDGDIPESILEYTYQIEIRDIDLDEREACYRENTVPVTVSLFGLAPRSNLEAYDCLLDKSRCIRDHIINISNFSQVGFIVDIESGSISARKLDDNDNAFKIDILLNFKQAYSTEE